MNAAASPKMRHVDPELQPGSAPAFVPGNPGGGRLTWLAILVLAGTVVLLMWTNWQAPPTVVVQEGERNGEQSDAARNAPPERVMPVSRVAAERRRVEGQNVLAVSGVVEPLGGKPLRVSAQVDGLVESLAVRPGDTVRPGMKLATLSNPALQARVRAQRSEVRMLRARAEALARKGRQSELAEARRRMQAASTHKAQKRQQLERAKRASPTAVAPRELERLEEQVRKAEQAAATAREHHTDRLREAAHEAQQAELRLEQAQARLAKLERDLAHLEVRVPRFRLGEQAREVESLEVAAVHVAVGSRVEAESSGEGALVDMIAPQRLQVRGYVPAEKAGILRLGDLVRRIRTRQGRAQQANASWMSVELAPLPAEEPPSAPEATAEEDFADSSPDATETSEAGEPSENEESRRERDGESNAAESATDDAHREQEETANAEPAAGDGSAPDANDTPAERQDEEQEVVAEPPRADPDGPPSLSRGFASMTARLRAPGLDRTLSAEFRGTTVMHDPERNAYVLLFELKGGHELVRPGLPVELELPLERSR